MSDDPIKRCEWALGDPALLAYHDAEWGSPEHDDRRLFEFLVLEGAQAGLFLLPVFKKSEGVRKTVDGFDPGRGAQKESKKGRKLLAGPGLIPKRRQNRGPPRKAKALLIVQKEVRR